MMIFCPHHLVVLVSAMAVAAWDDGRMLLRSPSRRALAKSSAVEVGKGLDMAVGQGEGEAMGQGQDKAIGQREGEAVGRIEGTAVGQGQGKAVGQGESEDVGQLQDKAVGQASAPDEGRKLSANHTDLGRRFNKFAMYPDYSGSEVILGSQDYPLSKDMSHALSYYSSAFSVVTREDFELKGRDIEKYIAAVGGYPTIPSNNPDSEFWKDLEVIAKAQIDRRNGLLPHPSVFTLPDLWKDYTAYDVAEAVHDEFPGINHVYMIDSFLTNGGIQLDYDILPFRCRDDFIGTKVRIAALNTWAVGTVAPVNFAAKWHVGRIRPEEIAWLIAKGDISEKDGANADVIKLIQSMKLQNATSFTQYPEGCPNHPSWPAMHSAKSSASLWLAVIAKLTPDQYCQALRTDFAVAYARTVAGVHYASDNIAGLNMGQTVIAEELADHLARTYGANKAAVEAKIKKLRFDWNTFDSEKCTVTYGTPAPVTPAPVTPAPKLDSCVEVDFSVTANNSRVSRGDYVENEWAEFGLTLSAKGGYGTRPRVFDTANPGKNKVFGDFDLGSPNKRCNPAGPGVGKGGEPDEEGENCTPLGNVLIIQEKNGKVGIPDDNMNGGSIIFDFEPKAQFVSKIGLLDIDYQTTISVVYQTEGGKMTTKTIKVPILGDNSYQELSIDFAHVKQLSLTTKRSGAVSSISFCH